MFKNSGTAKIIFVDHRSSSLIESVALQLQPLASVSLLWSVTSYLSCSKSRITTWVASDGTLTQVIRFSPSTDIAGHTPVKSSVQRAIRAAILSQWKIEPETLEAVWPKKEGLVHVKWSVVRFAPIVLFD